jgi:hypothetical protein
MRIAGRAAPERAGVSGAAPTARRFLGAVTLIGRHCAGQSRRSQLAGFSAIATNSRLSL